ncbi:hypothetical protein Tco_0556999 [Tanacetum coccineum]
MLSGISRDTSGCGEAVTRLAISLSEPRVVWWNQVDERLIFLGCTGPCTSEQNKSENALCETSGRDHIEDSHSLHSLERVARVDDSVLLITHNAIQSRHNEFERLSVSLTE